MRLRCGALGACGLRAHIATLLNCFCQGDRIPQQPLCCTFVFLFCPCSLFETLSGIHPKVSKLDKKKLDAHVKFCRDLVELVRYGQAGPQADPDAAAW